MKKIILYLRAKNFSFSHVSSAGRWRQKPQISLLRPCASYYTERLIYLTISIIISMFFVLSMPVCTYCEESESIQLQEEQNSPSIPLCIAVGAVVSIVGCFIRLQANKTVTSEHNATHYIKGGANVRVSEDIFLYRTETRVEKQREENR